MALTASTLVLLSHGNNEKVYRYTSSGDAMATILDASAAYFAGSFDMFDQGDIIHIEDSAGDVDSFRVSAEPTSSVVRLRRLNKVFLQVQINQTDLLAGTSQQLVSPVHGWIERLRTTVQAAVTTGGAITVENATTAVDGLSITVADSATAGTRQADTPTANHATLQVAPGDQLEIIPAAAFATAGAVNAVLEIG